MDYKDIIDIMKEMNQTDLTKLEFEKDGIRILMEKGANSVVSSAQTTISPLQGDTQLISNVAQSLTGQQPTSSLQSTINIDSQQKKDEIKGKQIVSPMVGTYYSQPAPEKPAFVKVGDRVKKGQTLCIIEAMKLMNEIESEYDGEIAEILVGNEEMVEYGQPLFTII